MNKILPFFLLLLSSELFAQSEPALRLFDVQSYQGELFNHGFDLNESDWQRLNPDGFPQFATEKFHSWHPFEYRGVYGREMRSIQLQFVLRKNNPERKGIWLAGVMLGRSGSSAFSTGHWERRSDYYITDTVNFSSGAPSQLLVADTLYNANRDFSYQSAHLGFSIGYQTNPSRLFSFKVRALLDFSVATRTSARYWGNTTVNTYMVTDTVDLSTNISGYQPISQDEIYNNGSDYSTRTVFGTGIQIPVGVSWQLSSFRPILSRFSLGLEMAGGLRLLSVPGLGVYSSPTFSIGATFAYRFKTWIPDNQNIRKLRAGQQ